MLRALRKRRFGMLFSIVAGFMVYLTVAPAQPADLLTDEKILEALKAKRLTRCPQAMTRCGGARLQHPPLKGRPSISRSPSMKAFPTGASHAVRENKGS
jgi:hypothetical protein